MEEIKNFLKENRGYIKWGAKKLANKFNVPKEKIFEIKAIIKLEDSIEASKKKEGKFKRIFFDIETSPNITYSWRIGYKLNLGTHDIIKERAIICISWKEEHDDKVHTLTWDENQCDKTMLEIFADIIKDADEVVGHNGDRFDIPWLRTRATIHNISFPPYVKSLDTLKKVRRGGFNFNSNKLDYLAQILLGENKLDTGGFSLWKSIIEDKCQESMAKMVEYCEKDVVLLERVYHRLENYIKPNSHVGSFNTGEKNSCPGCGSTKHKHIKKMVTAAGTSQHLLQCSSCNKYYKMSNTGYNKMIK